jgi:tetratricopeptide (TPR) repeat protein
LDKKYDDKIYECAMKAKAYEIASLVCNKYLNSPDDKVFIKWMKRKIEALWKLRKYKEVAESVDDLCNVMKKGCYKYLKYKFFSLWYLGKYKEALKVAKKLEKYEKFENVDVFIKIVKWALKNNDSLLAATYAKKIISLQEKYKTYPYSPFVEFVYAKYTKDKQEAIKVLKNLLNRVKGEDKARALFMLANLTGDKRYLEECLKVDDSKLWKGLCKDAISLF